jgi:hypothetical protein
MRAKGAWQVRAGIIPGTPELEFGRIWAYTSEDYEKDVATPPEQNTIFAQRRDEALEYAKGLIDPARLNWVEVTWIWY